MTKKEFEDVLGALDDAMDFLEDLSKKAKYNGKNNLSESLYTIAWDKDKLLKLGTEDLVAKLKTASDHIKKDQPSLAFSEVMEVKKAPESYTLDPAVKVYKDLMLIDDIRASHVESIEATAEGTKIRFDNRIDFPVNPRSAES